MLYPDLISQLFLLPQIRGNWINSLDEDEWIIEVMDGSLGHHHLKVMETIRQLAPEARLQFSDILDPTNHASTLSRAADRLEAILANENVPHLINCSWSFPRIPPKVEVDKIKRMRLESFQEMTYDQVRKFYPSHPAYPFTTLVQEVVRKGTIMVFAAGNQGHVAGSQLFPGRIVGANGLPEVITVGALEASGRRTPTSSYGPSTFCDHKPDIWAPGEFFLNDKLGIFKGTSAATAAVSGLIATMGRKMQIEIHETLN